MTTSTKLRSGKIGRMKIDWQELDLYRVFAFAFGVPARAQFDWFERKDFENFLGDLWIGLGCHGAYPGAEAFADFAAYEAAYISLFDVGAPQPPVPLVESAHTKSVAAQQIALENTEFYGVLGLRHAPAKFAPDHLVTQLEFLSAVRFAREQAATDENRAALARLERDFLDRHLLGWLPRAQKKLEKFAPPVFPALLTVLLAFLQQRRSEAALALGAEPQNHTPVLVR